MPTHAPRADPRVCFYAFRPGSHYASPNRHHQLVTLHANNASSSNIHYDSVPDNGLADIPALLNRPNGAHPGPRTAGINASLRLELEGLALGPVNSHGTPPVHGTVYDAVTIFPTILHASSTELISTSTPRGFEEAVDADDIAAEAILNGTSPAQQQPSRSRFFLRPIPCFNSSRHSPVPVPVNPARNRRAFTIPVPIFDIAPTVELPPSRDSSLLCVDLDEDLNAGMADVFSRINNGSFVLRSPPRFISNYFLSNFDHIIRVSPRNFYHPRPINGNGPTWVRAGVIIATNNPPVVSDSRNSISNSSTSFWLINEPPAPAMSTPTRHYAEPSFSFSYDNLSAYAIDNSGVQQYFTGDPGPSQGQYLLQYPPEEPSSEIAPFTSDVVESGLSPNFTFNHVRTGTLAPHPPGYLRQPGDSSWLDNIPTASASLPVGDGPSHSHGTDLERHGRPSGPHDPKDSIFGFYSEDSTNNTEIVGNRREESPFGPAIYPESFQTALSSTLANKPNRPVRIRRLDIAFITQRAQAGAPSPGLLTEPDDSVNQSRPSTPSPTSSIPRPQQSSTSVSNAYSLPPNLTHLFITGTENTLPPVNIPEAPSQTTSPPIAEPVGGEMTAESDQNNSPTEVDGSELAGASSVEGSGDFSSTFEEMGESVEAGETDLSELLDADLGSKVSEVSNDGQSLQPVVGSGTLATADESKVSRFDDAGDDEDESDNQDEYYELESERSPILLHYFSEPKGSVHSDDGHIHYTTDDGAI